MESRFFSIMYFQQFYSNFAFNDNNNNEIILDNSTWPKITYLGFFFSKRVVNNIIGNSMILYKILCNIIGNGRFSVVGGRHPTSYRGSHRCKRGTFQKWLYTPRQGEFCWNYVDFCESDGSGGLGKWKKLMFDNEFLAENEHVQSVWECRSWERPSLEWEGQQLVERISSSKLIIIFLLIIANFIFSCKH